MDDTQKPLLERLTNVKYRSLRHDFKAIEAISLYKGEVWRREA